MKINRVSFIPAVSFSAQGTLQHVLKKWKSEGFYVRELGKGNGNWTVYRRAKIEIELEDMGNCYV